MTKAEWNPSYSVGRNISVLWGNRNSSCSRYRPPQNTSRKGRDRVERLCVCGPMQREWAVAPAQGSCLGQGDDLYPLNRTPCLILASLDVHLHFSLPWVRIPTSDTGECRQSVLELSLAVTGEEKCNMNKCCAVHSVPGINCSAVASFGGATQKAVKASKKSQPAQCWVDEGRSKFNGLHELSSKPSADFSIFSGTFPFWHRSDIYRL